MSSTKEEGVAVKHGGGCGGFRSFEGAIVEVVIGRTMFEDMLTHVGETLGGRT